MQTLGCKKKLAGAILNFNHGMAPTYLHFDKQCIIPLSQVYKIKLVNLDKLSRNNFIYSLDNK